MLAAVQETHPSALDQIGNGGGGFPGVAAATGNGQDEVPKGKLGPMDFVKVFFHMGRSGLVG